MRNYPNTLFCFCIGCRVESKVASDSQSTASVTSTWFWSPTSRVQGISWRWAWKVQRLVGWAWAVTGVKIGSQTQFWLVSHSPSGSQAVTDAPPLHGTLCHLTGSLAKHSRERISGSELKVSRVICHFASFWTWFLILFYFWEKFICKKE